MAITISIVKPPPTAVYTSVSTFFKLIRFSTMRYRDVIKFPWSNVVGVAILFAPQAYAADLAPQSSQSGGVVIAVKPVEVSAGAGTWSFQVLLNTHSPRLSDHLAVELS
jgi:hypothetical protein